MATCITTGSNSCFRKEIKRMRHQCKHGFWIGFLLVGLLTVTMGAAQPPAAPTQEERAALQTELRALEVRLEALRRHGGGGAERWEDAELFAKGAAWALRYETALSAADL